jgi:hypothetical protein
VAHIVLFWNVIIILEQKVIIFKVIHSALMCHLKEKLYSAANFITLMS